MPYIAGHFGASFSATSGSAGATYNSIGSSREGIRHIQTIHHQPVIDDRGGEAQVDGIQQGADVVLRLDYVEYDKIAAIAFYPGSTGSQTLKGKIYDQVGKRLTDICGMLCLTPKPGTPAETNMGTGKSRVYYKAIITSDIEELLASKLRQGPCEFRCFPDPTNSDKVWDEISTPGGAFVGN